MENITLIINYLKREKEDRERLLPTLVGNLYPRIIKAEINRLTAAIYELETYKK